MRLLLDSHALIWAYTRPSELSVSARRAIADSENDRFISICSIWEIAIKQSLGKLHLSRDIRNAIADLALAVVPITLLHIERAQGLPFHHRDPFDRMMIAQAMEEGMTVVTRDRRFPSYGVPLLGA